MTHFARLTAITIMLLGAVMVILGAGLGLLGITQLTGSAVRLPALLARSIGIGSVATYAGWPVALQGILIIGAGQALWLIARMAEKTDLSIDYLTALVDRMGNAVRR